MHRGEASKPFLLLSTLHNPETPIQGGTNCRDHAGLLSLAENRPIPWKADQTTKACGGVRRLETGYEAESVHPMS